MSLVLIPRASKEIIFSSMPEMSRWYFGMSLGSNSPFRSLGTSIWNSPYWLLRFFEECPLRLLSVFKSPFSAAEKPHVRLRLGTAAFLTQDLKGRFIRHCKASSQEFLVKVFIHWAEKCLGIANHPVRHSRTCDCSAILFPVFFLTAVRKTVTKLLVHDPCSRTSRCHAIKHMRFSIFSFFYDRKLLLAAFWTAVIKAVDLNGFQFRRNKNKLTADKLFSNLNQQCITDRTKLIFLWKIKIDCLEVGSKLL